jgi:hypothetical protein
MCISLKNCSTPKFTITTIIERVIALLVNLLLYVIHVRFSFLFFLPHASLYRTILYVIHLCTVISVDENKQSSLYHSSCVSPCALSPNARELRIFLPRVIQFFKSAHHCSYGFFKSPLLSPRTCHLQVSSDTYNSEILSLLSHVTSFVITNLLIDWYHVFEKDKQKYNADKQQKVLYCLFKTHLSLALRHILAKLQRQS